MWIKDKVKVLRYPMPTEIEKIKFDYILNVSDEYISSCMNSAMKVGTKYFWFPLNECFGEMGLNSIYAAMQILHEAEAEDATTLIHCHAGVNRSQMIADCYYYMMNGEHRPPKEIDKEISAWINKGDGLPEDYKEEKLNQLQWNCGGHLPELKKMEAYLNAMKKTFEKDLSMRGGGLDNAKNYLNS